MKRIVTFLFLLGMTTMLFAQKDSTAIKNNTKNRFTDYENVSPWFFGVNVGATWHTTDVRTKLDYGFGATFGRSFLYKKNSPVFLDLRLRYLRAFVTGQDRDSTSAITENDALNGNSYSNVNYVANPGYAVNNFRTDIHRASLELVVHANRLRERKGLDLYAFGGVGLTFSKTKGNLLDDSDNQYNYGGLSSFDKESIDDLMDKTYESNLQGTTGKYGLRFMPSLGIGIGYQINPRLSVGLEHKMTFTMYDYFDGTDRDMADNSVSGNKDIYHYTSAYLRFHLKRKKPARKPISNPIDPIVPDPIPDPIDPIIDEKRPPVVEIYDPNRSPYTTTQTYFNLKAHVYYVEGRENIQFKQNGYISQEYTFNATTNEFESHVVLQPGQNIFEIRGTNEDGSVTDETVIIREVPNRVQPPIVSISNPPFSPYETSNQYFDLRGKVLNVMHKNQVTVRLNGQLLSNFNFNTTNGSTAATLALREGQNTVTIKGVNEVGQDQKTVYIRYERPVQQQPPIVDFINPNQLTTTVSNANYNILASVLNVTQKSQITVRLNGSVTNNFSYNNSTRRLMMNVPLIVGANIISIYATNAVGNDQEARTIIYKRHEQLHPPVVTYLNPNQNPITVYNSQQNVLARIDHITNSNQIVLKVNGIQTNNFSFSNSSKQLFVQSSLVVGANIFEIKATNSAGQDIETTTIIYQHQNVELPPVVKIELPSTDPFTTYNANAKVLASVLNVDQANQISVRINGVPTSNFIYNTDTKVLRINKTLVLGSNLFEVTATNLGGTDADQTTIVYKQEPVLRPTAVWLTPTTSPISTFQSSYYLTGKVGNINSKNQVVVKKNGVSLSQNLWGFNLTTKVVTLNTGLVLGNNIFEIKATNSAGTASDETIILYEEEPCVEPTIQWLSPIESNITVSNSVLLVKAKILEATNAQSMTIRVNGIIQTGVGYNSTTNEISKNVTLNEGNNVIQIHAGNNCGITTVNTTVSFIPEEVPCFSPEIIVIQPQQTMSTYENTQLLKATLQNIDNSAQITFNVNGSGQAYTFDPATHLFSANPNLVSGLNTCQMIVSNDCGSTAFTWNISKVKCANPIVTISNPTGTSLTTSEESIMISGSVMQVENNNQISVKHNGAMVSFVYNLTSKLITINRVLTPGLNQITVRATNSCGQSEKNISITYNEPVTVDPPAVQFTNPTTSPFETTNSSFNATAQITNIPHKSQIMVWVNDVQTQSFTYNTSTGTVSINRTLNVGDNVYRIRAVNEAGMDQKTTVVRRNVAQVVLPPIVAFVKPSAPVTYPTNSTIQVIGYVSNITAPSGMKIYINNRLFTGYTTIMENGKMKFSFSLSKSSTQPENIIKVTATNSAGNTQQSRTINFQRKKVPNKEIIKLDPKGPTKPTGNTTPKRGGR